MTQFKRWEAVLVLTVLLLFTYAAMAGMQQQALADDVLRLHVLANSDSREDQRIKLCVRDRVLAYCEPLLTEAHTQAQVRAVVRQHLQQIANVAQLELWLQGAQDSVAVKLDEEYYPTRDYETFSLPAGQYVGLRVEIGSARGHNWWCVIYPPMCRGAAVAEPATLSQGERALTRRDGTRFVVRFKAAELVGALRHRLTRG